MNIYGSEVKILRGRGQKWSDEALPNAVPGSNPMKSWTSLQSMKTYFAGVRSLYDDHFRVTVCGHIRSYDDHHSADDISDREVSSQFTSVHLSINLFSRFLLREREVTYYLMKCKHKLQTANERNESVWVSIKAKVPTNFPLTGFGAWNRPEVWSPGALGSRTLSSVVPKEILKWFHDNKEWEDD